MHLIRSLSDRVEVSRMTQIVAPVDETSILLGLAGCFYLTAAVRQTFCEGFEHALDYILLFRG